MIITRNNIILSLLVIATELHFSELEEYNEERNSNIPDYEKERLFLDLSFLNPVIEKFKCMIVEIDNIYNTEYDVEVLFLALLGYKEKAQIIKQKHNNYFKHFINDCQLSTFFNFDLF